MIATYSYHGIQHRVFLEGSWRTDGHYELEVKPIGYNKVITAVASDSDTAIRNAVRQLEKIFGSVEA